MLQRITSTYYANINGIIPILKGQKMEDAIVAVAEGIAQRARTDAPVRSGAYRDSIGVVVDQHPTRVAAHVVTTVDYGLVIEVRRQTLRRALA